MVKRKLTRVVNKLKALLIQRGIEVNKIVIFGSWTKQSQNPESDIDIVVVSKDFEQKDIFKKVKMINGINRELVKEIMLPVDIMYYSISEWQNGSSLIIDTAKKKEFFTLIIM